MQTLEAIHRRVLNRTCRVHGSACGMRNRQGKVSRQSRLKYYREASTTSASSSPPSHVVVLGAGISGLTSAFYLQRRYPDTKITVLEEQKRIGGWIKTNTVDLGSEYGRVVLETGPRTLRAVSHELLELVNLLQLQSQLVLTPKSSPAATKLNSIQPSGDGFLVRLQTGETVSASHLISALPLHTLGELIPPNQSLPHLNFNPSSTVQVINFVFACSRADLHPEGFGYLKPRPANGYDGPDRGILGTVFDSCALSDQDTAGSKPITKVTVMCGGPYSHSTSSLSVDRILDELFIHLGKKRMEPIHVEVHEQRDCIPTPLVGHLERMDHLRRILREEPWNGRLQVIGAGVNGAGIADCVQAARAGAFGV
ncbi:oxygen-dependent protoporphyrinogen oxidase [Serendipita sp. 400]|nr:oxygen-dependent protoporphyrinogen oxidase [Serendipita sp. 400]